MDEYRTGARSDLVEWFVALRDAGCSDWLIVFDSLRSRETKQRAVLLEKLKTDFPKFVAKIIEVESNVTKMPTLIRSLREQIITSLDSVVVAFEEHLQTEKEKCYSVDWNLLSYIDSQVRTLIRSSLIND